MKIPKDINGVYTIRFRRAWTFVYDSETGIAELLKDTHVVRTEALTPGLDRKGLKLVMAKVINMIEEQQLKAATIGRLQSHHTWKLLATGAWGGCRNIAKRAFGQYREVKVIYQHNLPQYGLKAS